MFEKFFEKKPSLLQACYFLFGALCISIDGGYSSLFFALLIFSLPFLFQKKASILWMIIQREFFSLLDFMY